MVLGSDLARRLNVRVGSNVNLFALSGGGDTDLFAEDRMLEVTGIFTSGYADINSTYAFVSLETSEALLGSSVIPFYGIKISNSEHDGRVIARLEKQ